MSKKRKHAVTAPLATLMAAALLTSCAGRGENSRGADAGAAGYAGGGPDPVQATEASAPSAAPERSSRELIEDMVFCYANFGREADRTIDRLLEELRSADPDAAARWAGIMEAWKAVEEDLSIQYDVLPDGLPDTDELCIVALGFQLNPDGTMREELIERLKVVKESAEKYPHAWIVCTGGGTAARNRSATEAGNMAEWLIGQGVDSGRILVEDRSLTTAQNAIFTYELLAREAPQVRSLAIISSDYHIATGTLLFAAEAILRSEVPGEPGIAVTANAAWQAPSGSLSATFQAGALMELAGDADTAFKIYYGG